MKLISFSVLTERWIPCRGLDGVVRDYGLLDMLKQAHQLEGIMDPAPPIQFGLYRVAIAFVMDAFSLTEPRDLVDLLDRKQFDIEAIHRYVASVAPTRFDLFDKDTPFLQTNVLSAERTSVASLLPHMPSGHFHHWPETDQAFSPAICARSLVTIAPFMTQGGRGYSPSINGAPPWYVLVRGANLFETLLLNCFTGSSTTLTGDEGPAWRSAKRLAPRQPAYCDSLLEGLTWRPRQVRLIPGEGGTCTYSGEQSPVLVREIWWGPGLAFRGQGGWFDPNVAYRYSAEGISPLRPQEDRVLWRDTGPLLLLRREKHGQGENRVAFERPWVVSQFWQLRNDYDLYPDRRFDSVEAYGMRTKQMKVFEWQCERLTIPDAIARNRFAPEQVRTAVERAEAAAWCLKDGLTAAYPRHGSGNQDATGHPVQHAPKHKVGANKKKRRGKQEGFGRLIQRAQQTYWARLDEPFRSLLEAIAAEEPEDAKARQLVSGEWINAIRKAATDGFETTLGPLDTDAKALRRQTDARSRFQKRLAWVLLPTEERAKRKEQRERGSTRNG
jgi:CRISPR system Cascade subunit CasA